MSSIDYINRPLLPLTQAQAAAMSQTLQNKNVFNVYPPYRTPSAIIPGVKQISTEDRGKNIILSMDGHNQRRNLNIIWISLGLLFSFVMLYVAYAALADTFPFSRRGPAGGTTVPKEIEIDRPASAAGPVSGLSMPFINDEPIIYDSPPPTGMMSTMASSLGEDDSLEAPRISVIEKATSSNDDLSPTYNYEYGIMRVNEENLEPLDFDSSVWSQEKTYKTGDKVKITLYPKRKSVSAAILRRDVETGDVNVIATVILSPRIPRILFDQL